MAVQSSEAPVIHLLSAENSPHLGGKRLRVVVDYFTWWPLLRYSFIKCFWIPFNNNKGKRKKNNEVTFDYEESLHGECIKSPGHFTRKVLDFRKTPKDRSAKDDDFRNIQNLFWGFHGVSHEIWCSVSTFTSPCRTHAKATYLTMHSSWVSLTTLHRVDHKARTTNDHFPHT